MKYSHHANKRAQQRAIPPMLIDLLIQFGQQEKSGDGTAKVFFDKRARKRLRAYAGPLAGLLEQHLDVYAVVAPDQQVITVAHRQERISRH
jgi:hypothetical protein